MGIPAVARIRRTGQLSVAGWVMECIVEPRHHTRLVAKGRVAGHILDALTVDPDFTSVAQAVEIFCTVPWPMVCLLIVCHKNFKIFCITNLFTRY